MEKDPEPRTLHGKSFPSSTGRNSCLRILICLAKLSSCDEGGNAEPKLKRIPQVEVKPFMGCVCGGLLSDSLHNVSLWTVATMAYLASFPHVHAHLGKDLVCLIRIRASSSNQAMCQLSSLSQHLVYRWCFINPGYVNDQLTKFYSY